MKKEDRNHLTWLAVFVENPDANTGLFLRPNSLRVRVNQSILLPLKPRSTIKEWAAANAASIPYPFYGKSCGLMPGKLVVTADRVKLPEIFIHVLRGLKIHFLHIHTSGILSINTRNLFRPEKIQKIEKIHPDTFISMYYCSRYLLHRFDKS